MKPANCINLNECTEYRQALRAQTPHRVHITALLLTALVMAAVVWMALTKANLVVTGNGRVRPISDTETADDQVSHEISSQRDGRVATVDVNAGDEVKEGDVLVRLETNELDITIDKTHAAIAANEAKVEQTQTSLRLLAERHRSADQKVVAEIEEAISDLEQAKQRRANDIEVAKVHLATAQDKATRIRKLTERAAVPEEKLVEVVSRLRVAQTNLVQAKSPVPEGRVSVLKRSRELLQREHQVEEQRLATVLRALRDQIDSATFDLARLMLQKEQSIIRSQTDCIVTRADVKVGDMVRAGKLGITTARCRGFEFELEVSSADVAHLRTEMPVQVKIDAYDYQKYGVLRGTVRFVAPDSALKSVSASQQTAVYLVKVTLNQETLARGSHRGDVKLGMTGKAEIITESESILLILLRKMQRKISLG